MKKLSIGVTLLLLAIQTVAYEVEKAGFSVSIFGEINPYKIYSVFVLPETEFNISSDSDIRLISGQAEVYQTDNKNWKVAVPALPGGYFITIFNSENKDMLLNVLVMTPISEKKGEYLNGYRIGYYTANSARSNPIYDPPKGFFEIIPVNS